MGEPEYNGHGGSVTIEHASDPIVESQSTQLLDFVLGRAEPWNSLAQTSTSKDETSSDQHLKSSGNASHGSASVVSYHFHGLASTQTQGVGSDGSQKENEYAEPQSPPGRSARDAPSRPSNSVQRILKGSLTPSRALTTNVLDPSSPCPPPQPTKAVSFLSPSHQAPLQKAPTKASVMPYRRQPSPTIPSQDSFAGPTASQDPDLFLATSRQFEIPLDQLGQTYSPEVSPVESRVGRISVTSSEPAPANRSMDDYSLSSSSSTGNILVPNSLKSDSRGTSQNSDRHDYYSISQEPTQLLSDASISEHEDAYERTHVTGEHKDTILAQVQTQEATQIVEESASVEPGQRSAVASVVSNALSQLSLGTPDRRDNHLQYVTGEIDGRSRPNEERNVVPVDISPVATSSTSNTNRRSLLSVLSPEKRSRYMHHFQESSASVSEASRYATAGTSSGNRDAVIPNMLSSLPTQEEAVEDSELQIDMDVSPQKGAKSCDQEVIPPSESDLADWSREDDEVEQLVQASKTSPKSLSVIEKGKQRADVLQCNTSRKPVSPSHGRNSPSIALPKRNTVAPDKKPTITSPPKSRTIIPPSSEDCRQREPTPSRSRALIEDAEMPPTELQQDAPSNRGRRQPRNVPKARTNKDVEPEQATSTSPTTVQDDQSPPVPTAPLPSSLASSQDSPEIPLARAVNRRMEEEESEAGEIDDIAMEESDKAQWLKQGPQTRKRKRRNATLTTKKQSKGKVATRKVNARATSVAPPPTKKARTSSVVKRFGAGVGTQVFALYKTDSCFWGAEVHTLNGNRAHVKFFDGCEDPNLGIAQMRRFELKKGDIVIPGTKSYKAKVVDVSTWASENEVNVEYVEGPEEGLEITVAADGLRIPSRTIQSQWKDRTLDLSDITPAVVRKTLKDTPSPSKTSMVNVGASRTVRNKLLSRHGIIITQGPGNQNWCREKEKYTTIVKDYGGIVLSDWQDILTLQGKHSNGNKRWTIQRTDVKFSPKDKNAFDRVFLISDVHNQKPKYLLALALGIPCVSVDWLEHISRGEEIPWSRFLLAAGHSEPLGAPISQMVDLDWGSSVEHLTEIMENSVPQKVLSGTSVLCVGSDLFPQPARKCYTDADRVLEASRTVPRIILAMGADRVEAVADVKNASERLSRYTYVIVKESVPKPRVRDATYVDVTWIKECLIAGRLLPVPEWEEEE